jgi:hypothetical protein
MASGKLRPYARRVRSSPAHVTGTMWPGVITALTMATGKAGYGILGRRWNSGLRSAGRKFLYELLRTLATKRAE